MKKPLLTPTSYHLAIVLLAYTNSAGNSARKRLNLLEEAFSDVEAKLQAKTDLPAEIEPELAGIRASLRELRDDYEPIIDLDPWSHKKLAAFEGFLIETRTRIMILIENHCLVEKQDISEVMLSPILSRGQA